MSLKHENEAQQVFLPLPLLTWMSEARRKCVCVGGLLGLILPLLLPFGGLTSARTGELGSQDRKDVKGEPWVSFWPWPHPSAPRTGLDSGTRLPDLNNIY